MDAHSSVIQTRIFIISTYFVGYEHFFGRSNFISEIIIFFGNAPVRGSAPDQEDLSKHEARKREQKLQ